MNVNILDVIPDEKPHCGNCLWLSHPEEDELFHFCDREEKEVPTFGLCDKWKKKEIRGNENEIE